MQVNLRPEQVNGKIGCKTEQTVESQEEEVIYDL